MVASVEAMEEATVVAGKQSLAALNLVVLGGSGGLDSDTSSFWCAHQS